MINVKKIFFLIFSLLILNSVLQAQNYDSAVGVRLGYPRGITYKQFTGHTAALEFIVGIGERGSSLTVLFEEHSEVFDYSMNLVYGVGGHAGIWRDYLNVGIDGILGLEFTPNSPFVFAIDYKPTVFLWRSNIRTVTEGAFSVRYAF